MLREEQEDAARNQGPAAGLGPLPPGAAEPGARTPGMTDRRHAARRDAAIKLTKAVHTLAWFSIESCVFYLLYAGFTGRSDRRAAIAAGVVAGESLVFAASGFRCPLTVMAERLGADHGSVTDVCLPDRLAHRLPEIHVPLLLLAGYLHAIARRRRRQLVHAVEVRGVPPRRQLCRPP